MPDNEIVVATTLKDDYEIQLKSFEKGFLSEMQKRGLPIENIFVDLPQRLVVFGNIDNVLQQISKAHLKNSVYIVKFLAATASGLFDAALNYLWDETIQEIRKRVIQYDVEYFYDNATTEEKRKKLKGPDDIVKLDDNELIFGARNIGLISELGFRHLDYIRYMRNWASAAHPNQNSISGLQLISWLETCIREVISLPLSSITTEIKHLLSNIKTNALSQSDAIRIAQFFDNLSQQQVNNLASGFSGIYVDPITSSQTRQNINYLLPYLWNRVDEDTRQYFGIKYGKFIANNEKERATLSRQFLEIVNAISYMPEDLKAAEIDIAVEDLLSAHRSALGNFYSEPPFARQLFRLVGKTGKIPPQVRKKYVLCLTEAFLTNGNGVAWNAENIYISLIQNFDQQEATITLLSFQEDNISSRLQLSLCSDKYRELIALIEGKISAPAVKELLDAVKKFTGRLDIMRNDERIKQKIVNLNFITS